MIFHRETAGCNGRGFANANTNGFLAKFKTWIQTAAPNGPGWTIIDDQSMDPSQGKWGSVKSYNAGVGTSFDTLAEVDNISNGSFRITIGAITKDITGMNFSAVTTWEDVSLVIQTAIRASDTSDEFTGAVCKEFLNRYTGQSYPTIFPYYREFKIVAGVRGVDVSYLSATGSGTNISGSSHLSMISGQGIIESGTNYPYIVVCSNSSPNWNDTPANKYIQIGYDGTAGRIYINTWMNWDSTIHEGFGRINQNYITTVDAGAFVYDFRGGDEMMNIHSFISGTWYSYTLDEFVGDNSLVEPVSIKGITTAAVTTAMNSVTLGTGEGSLFTEGNFYFLIDLDRSDSVQYMKIATGGIVGDTITFTSNFNAEAKAGAILSPYYHRFYLIGTSSYASTISRIPYVSFYGREQCAHSADAFDMSGCIFTTLYQYLIRMAPNDKGKYACMRPGISEKNYYNYNRSYGSCKNLYLVQKSTMNPGTDGKIINGKNYLFFKLASIMTNGSSELAILIPDFDENT